MDPSIIATLAFVGIAATVAGGGMLLRDLFAPRADSSTRPKLKRLPLDRRPNRVSNEAPTLEDRFERLIVETGIDVGPWTTFGLMIACALALGGTLFLWNNEDLLAGGIGAAVGLILPLPYLMYRREQRLRQLREQMPRILDLLARALHAGESLDQAVDLAGREGGEPLALEFRRCARHLDMGLALPAAMRALMARVQIMEMRIFGTTLAVHRQTGGNLAKTLERMSAVVRDRINYRRQLRSVTAAGRFAAMLIASAGPLLFLFMFTFQRLYVAKMLESPIGQGLLVVAATLELVGLVWLWRLLKHQN